MMMDDDLNDCVLEDLGHCLGPRNTEMRDGAEWRRAPYKYITSVALTVPNRVTHEVLDMYTACPFNTSYLLAYGKGNFEGWRPGMLQDTYRSPSTEKDLPWAACKLYLKVFVDGAWWSFLTR